MHVKVCVCVSCYEGGLWFSDVAEPLVLHLNSLKVHVEDFDAQNHASGSVQVIAG